VANRVDGLYDEACPGRPRTVTDADVERVIVDARTGIPLSVRTLGGLVLLRLGIVTACRMGLAPTVSMATA
jgi:hypothetical protein